MVKHGTFRWMAGVIALLILVACGQNTGSTSGNTGATTSGEGTGATSPAASGEAVTVRLGYFPNLTHGPALVGVARGTFKDALGPNVTLDVKTFNAGPAMIEALFAGEIDLGYIGPNPAINGYVKSKGDALRIIAGASSGGALFVVRPEANIKTGKDLDGKKFASPQLGGTQDVALRYYIQQNGLKTAENGGTVEIVPTQNPDILTLFQQGQIDGAWVPEPWATRLVLEAKGQVLVDERTTWPDGKFVTTHIIASRKFLGDHSDLVKKFLTAHVDTVEFINKNPDEAKKIVNSEIERITGKALAQQVLDDAFKNLDTTYDPLAKSLFVSADHAFDLGFLGETKPDLSGIYSLDLLNEVLQERDLPPVASS